MKLGQQLETYPLHRIIIPVYVPSIEGFYSDGFQILQFCLLSLTATLQPGRANITVIDNGCAAEVRDWLLKLLAEGRIDQLVVNRVNRGKPDAIFAAARAAYEPFVTFSDADVLFEHGWLDAVEQIFRHFPEAAMVCPFPSHHVRHLHCVATWLRYLGKLRYGPVVSEADMRQFAISTGKPERYSPSELTGQWYIERAGVKAVIGASHFTVTCRNGLIRYIPSEPSLIGLGVDGLGERALDRAADKLGLVKLSTPRAHVRHLGHRLEPWMQQVFQRILAGRDTASAVQEPELTAGPSPGWPAYIPNFVMPLAGRFLKWYDRRRTMRWGERSSSVA